MPIPPTSHEAILEAMLQFSRGERSPQGPRPGTDWLGDSRYHYVIVHEGEPYPVKEIIRLAVKRATEDWPSRFWGGPSDANRYVKQYGFTVVRKEDWAARSH